MATRPWIFLINTFYVNTVDSMKSALSLTNDHLAKLVANEADAEILAIKTAYLPFHTAFITIYSQLESKLGYYHGQTQTFEEMLEELQETKINEWRGTVFNVFPENTPGAKTVFPQDRAPFNSGTRDDRVIAVHTLSVTLAGLTAHPTLVALSAVVEAYYLTLSGARALQQTDEGGAETLRTNLKAAHKLMCDMMYHNLGLLMAKFYDTPETVADYYDLSLLRKTSGSVEKSATLTLAADTVGNFDLTEMGIDFEKVLTIEFKTELSPGDYYAAENAASGPGSTFIHVAADSSTVREAEDAEVELGADETHTFINVKNVGTVLGHYTIIFTVGE